jgi:membrane associated rhomboid family serine protease
MMCGTTTAQGSKAQPRREHADPETLRFLRAVIARPATFTFVFIITNVFLYLLMWLSGGATGEVLQAYGAKLNRLIDEGQWWRFVTPIFLHMQLPGFGWFPIQLLVNMYGLFILGSFVERLYGSAKFVVFWVLTGVAGVAASYLAVRPELAHGVLGQLVFKSFDVPSAGASGALFGLMGLLLVFGLKYRHELPEGLKHTFKTGLLPALLLNLFIGYMWPGLAGNTPHLGGLVCGMVLGLVVGYERPGRRGSVAHAWHVAQVACLALVVVSFAMVARHFDTPPPHLENPSRHADTPGVKPLTARPFAEAINDGQNALARFFRGDSGGLAPALAKLEQAPSFTPKGDALRDDLKTLVARARDIANDKALGPQDREQRSTQLSEDFGTWQDEFSQWVDDEGRDLRVNIQKPGEEK